MPLRKRSSNSSVPCAQTPRLETSASSTRSPPTTTSFIRRGGGRRSDGHLPWLGGPAGGGRIFCMKCGALTVDLPDPQGSIRCVNFRCNHCGPPSIPLEMWSGTAKIPQKACIASGCSNYPGASGYCVSHSNLYGFAAGPRYRIDD
jgi:hypothetical protein